LRSTRSRVFPSVPPAAPNQRIGLYGGSFNPPHRGHRHVSLVALRRLRLDRVWWLVTPGNPLKDTHGLPPQAMRMRAAAAVADHPRLVVTGLEAGLGTRYTAEVAARLVERLPGVRLVLVIGADSLASLHRWRDWRRLAATLPIAVVNRPGFAGAALSAPAALALARFRLPERDAPRLAYRRPPAWVFLVARRTPLSSTALRLAAARKA